MSDQPEPLVAILKEMRGNEFDDPHLDADGIIGARRLARDWADRIDAAAERERTDLDAARAALASLEEELERLRAPGNSAAMREALLDSNGLLREIRGEWSDAAAGQIADNKAALAAPARNCDTVRDGREALGWCRESVAVERDAAYDRGMRDAIRWLLAPAEKGAEK